MAYESIYPRTAVGTLEIKTLPARTTLIASAPGDAFKDRGAAFRQLFSYINANKVAMSVPVEASASTNEMLFLVGSDGSGRSLASGKGVTVREILTAFEKVYGQQINKREAPRRPGDAAGAYANADTAKRLLGWETHLSIEDGIRDALRWGDKRKEVLGY